MRFSPPVVLVVLCLGVAVVLAIKHPSCGPDEPDTVVVPLLPAEPPIPAPPGVLGEVTIPTPNTSWKALQTLVGGVVALAPPTFAAVVSSSVGADASLADQIDATAPARGLVVGDESDERFVWALRLSAPERVKRTLVGGDAAKFSEAGTEAGIDVFLPSGSKGGAVLGLAHGGFLVVAPSRADLAAFGPYAYRTLPTQPTPASALSISIPRATFAGPLRSYLTKRIARDTEWLEQGASAARKDHGGREPDFGDPEAVIKAVDGWSRGIGDALADMDHAVVDVNVDDSGLVVDVALTPSASGASHAYVASMHPGDASPLLDAPSGMILSALVRSDEAERSSNVADVETTLAAMTDKRLADPDKKKLFSGLDAFAKARGDYVLVSLGLFGLRGLAVSTRVGDDAKAMQAVGDVVDVAMHKPLYGLLETSIDAKSTKTAALDLPPLGKGRVVTVTRGGTERSLLGPELSIGFASKDGVMALGVGPDAAALVKASAAPEHKLAVDPRVAAAVGTLGHDVTVAAVIVPGAGRAAARSDAAVVGWGRRGGDGWLHVDTTGGAARQLVSLLMKGL